jgi:hypothetical protein
MFVSKTHAQEDAFPERDLLLQNPVKEAPSLKRDTPPIVSLGTDFQNSVLLLNNRFRVDSDVDEVTMVFFRDRGSAPVVLVRPDGSKLFIENDEEDPNVQWYETQTYDMITIKKPMPGPWQAVGQVLEGSKVMVIADIVLDAQPIPRHIYSGEIIKQTAVLKNNGKQVDFSPFRDVVSLTIQIMKTLAWDHEPSLVFKIMAKALMKSRVMVFLPVNLISVSPAANGVLLLLLGRQCIIANKSMKPLYYIQIRSLLT